MAKKQVPVRLDALRLQRFEDYAKASGLKKQTILERALDQFMADKPAKPRPRSKKRGV